MDTCSRAIEKQPGYPSLEVGVGRLSRCRDGNHAVVLAIVTGHRRSGEGVSGLRSCFDALTLTHLRNSCELSCVCDRCLLTRCWLKSCVFVEKPEGRFFSRCMTEPGDRTM